MLATMPKTRYRSDFFTDETVRGRFNRFYEASLLELGEINLRPPFNAPGCSLPAPWRIICGHTHQPMPWDNPLKLDSVSQAPLKRLTLYNTGGWLIEDEMFVGAEIFKYVTGQGFTSIPVS